MKRTDRLTVERLKELLDYDPESGVFTWRVDRNHNAKAGDIAGYVDKSIGYIRIRIDDVPHPAHRLAVIYHTGELIPPLHDVHHLNEAKTDNRIDNLEVIHTRLHTCQHHSDRGTGFWPKCLYPGVMWDQSSGKWQARTKIDGCKYHLGMFTDAEEAWETICSFRTGRARALELKRQLAAGEVPNIDYQALFEILGGAQPVSTEEEE